MTSFEQAFRTKSSTGLTTIPTRLDNKTGKHIILWKDIQQYFTNAQGVLNDGKAVLFLTDDDFEYLTPLRIAYCPGTVLEVVSDAVSSASSNTGPGIDHSTPDPLSFAAEDGALDRETSSQAANSTVYDSKDHIQSPMSTIPEKDSASQQGAKQPISSARFPEGTPVSQPGAAGIDHSSYSVRATRVKELRKSYLEAIKAGHIAQATAIKEAMSELLEKLQATMDKNRDLQDLVLQLQQTMEANQEESRHQLVEMQQQMDVKQQQVIHMQQQTIQMQQQALDRLAIIQDRVQSLITQNYELHEYPIPRLFIVLPKQTRRRDKILKPFADQFQLYFLCECGTHTMPEGSTTPHEIHMAKHEGYELDKPNEFFEKYGSYILAVMYMIKYGVMAAGLIVSPLGSLKVVEGIDSTQGHLEHVKKNIGPLVDDSIAFLQDLKNHVPDGILEEGEGDYLQLDKLEVLEGADLRQLESYLKITDKHRVLGNLYRIVTLEGHVKWVCVDHYRANYRESAAQRLREAVEINGGSLKEDLGEMDIKVTSNTLAKQVYDAIVKARGIQRLHITMAWDATMSDLQRLADAVTSANIIDLTVDGQCFEGPTRDLINRGRRYDPIMRLLSNGRLQALTLIHFKDLFQRVTDHSLTTAPKLRMLRLQSPLDIDAPFGRSLLQSILVNCPNLVGLSLEIHNPESLVKVILDILDVSQKLEILRLHHGDRGTTAIIRGGKIETIDILVPFSEESSDERFKANSNHLSHDSTAKEPFHGNQITDLLRHSPKLSNIGIHCMTEDPYLYLDFITLTRQAILTEGGTTALRRVEITHSGIEAVIFVEFRDSPADSHVDPVGIKIIAMRATLLKKCPRLIRYYGWSIDTLDTQSGDIDDELALLLDEGTKSKGSKLRSLECCAQSVSREGLELVDRVIGRSQSLERLRFTCESLGDQSEREKAEWFLARNSERLTGLHLRGPGTVWLTEWLVEAYPTRHALPKLTELELRLFWSDVPEIPLFVEWIVIMVSALPSQLVWDSTSSSALDAESKELSEQASNTSPETWAPLTRLSLHGIKLQQEDWARIIMAIDFTTLEELDLTGSNFSLQEFDLLVDCIGSTGWMTSRQVLDLSYTRLSTNKATDELRAIVQGFCEKVPFVTLKGLDQHGLLQ
ncbi:hypothetical protein BGX34_009989 [Mortierella sp. NVP85]|nr:hypothetical protein BGX34_009989 [Mortierella sp. NVP85]